ncbi:hypothetical protein AQI96_21470 [Streptomyces canus]|nr:hypothetical protein AQI96_21470 [Streptomyces canus]
MRWCAEPVQSPSRTRSSCRPYGRPSAQQHLADRRFGDDPPVGVREPAAQEDEQLSVVAADVGGEASARLNSSTWDPAVPSNRLRSRAGGSSAAEDRGCGAQPEWPSTEKRQSPRAPAGFATSRAASATRRPGGRSESPWPGRS